MRPELMYLTKREALERIEELEGKNTRACWLAQKALDYKKRLHIAENRIEKLEKELETAYADKEIERAKTGIKIAGMPHNPECKIYKTMSGSMDEVCDCR